MKAGDVIGPVKVDGIPTQTIRAWSGFLADPNPIHLDPAAVAAIGLGNQVISQGPLNLAIVMNLLTSNLGKVQIEQLESRFVGNVFAAEPLIAQGRICAVENDRVTCEATLEAEGRGPVITCTATLRVVP
ncbi:MaoC family dehydratase [Povalibacter sp.]|uniref:MaoC family dehydratase n=1 Tax=Povalibacter sp. TaxID=1962978 RepID=UPI002F3F3E99